MHILHRLLLLLVFSIPPWVEAEKLTLEVIHSDIGLDGPGLRSAKFSPDSKLLTYLKNRPDDKRRYDLWAYDLEKGTHFRLVNADELHEGEEQLSDEEKARRERMRLFATGIISYQWNEQGSALLFPLAGDLYYYNLADKKARQLTRSDTFELDAKFSRDGSKVAFIRDQNIYVLDLESGKETALTTDGKGPIKNGMAEFVAQEEMRRLTGYWWSPDSKQIAFLRVDESQVEEIQRNEIYADRIEVVKQRYPYTGKTNASLKLGIIAVESGSTRWIDTGSETDIYLPRVQWSERPDLLTYQWQSRNQQSLELRGVNPASGVANLITRDTSNTWINLHDDLRFLESDNSLIWSSERTGYRHLYHIREGKTITLTRGDWPVDRLSSIDGKNGWVYFEGWVKDPTERHLYRVRLDGRSAEKPEKISRRPGTHSVTFSKDSRYYLDSYSNVNQPTQVSLHKSDGTRLTWLVENRLDESHPLHPYLSDWIEPVFDTLEAEDGTLLHYQYYRPTTPMPEKGYPAIVQVYGGPGAQTVSNSWRGGISAQYLAGRGYVVFKLDNRGMANRGKAFEDVLYKQFGEVELRDQISGATWLKNQPWVDEKRVAIKGHSYGGYMTLMAMFKAPGVFAAGVSGAPVTDFRLYDTHYTERFLSTPQENPEGYEQTSVFPHSEGLDGRLLIYHGMADDNVLFVNTTKLIKQLQDQGKVFEFMAYPGAKHGLSGNKTQIHLGRTIDRFLDETIGASASP